MAASAASDPDFLSLVEENRFAPTTKNIASPKNQARLREKKKAYWNENISLRLVPPPDEGGPPQLDIGDDISSESTGTWNIPRFRLDGSFLGETVNRGRHPSSPLLLVSHLYDKKSNSVILPNDDMRVKCRASPVIYDVIVHFAGGIKRGGVLSVNGDSYYKGDVIFFIQNVPELSKSEKYIVTTGDVRRWLVNGAISTVESIQIGSDKVRSQKEIMQQLEKDMKNVHAAPLFNEHGRAIVGPDLESAREARFEFLRKEKETATVRLEKAKQSLEAARARHFSACALQITERREKVQNIKDARSLSFSVKLTGGKKKDYYTDLISKKLDWNLVPMFATGTGDKTSKKSKHKISVSHENKSAMVVINEADEADHFVDVGLVSILILPDGQGVHEAYAESDPFAISESEGGDARSHHRCQHRLFHGNFCEGEYHEGTLHTDRGVYSGSFLSNEPSKGKIKYSDGVILDGVFALPPQNKWDGREEAECQDDSPLGPNPYKRGLSHKYTQIQFKDGSSYEGEMWHGHITGNGTYRYPRDDIPITKSQGNKSEEITDSFREIKGDFVNGILQNNDGVEGQGGSNLLRSLIFDGERLWGP